MQPQQQNSSKKTLLIVIVIVIISLSVFFYYKGSPTDSNISSVQSSGSPESVDAQIVGTRVLSLLNQISELKIDSSIFSSAVYKTLIDYTVEIPTQDVGRLNPFAPIGR